MRVVDASVLVAAMVDTGPDGVWALTRLMGDDLAVPELALIEASNVLRRLERAGQVPERVARAALDDLLDLDLTLVPYAAVADRVWELRANLTAYDATYVATAEVLGAPLATLDLRLTRAPGPTCAFDVPDPPG